MKIKEKLKQFREMTELELNNEIDVLKKEIFNIRFQLALSRTGDFSKIRYNKRLIARIKTVLTEKAKANKEAEIADSFRQFRSMTEDELSNKIDASIKEIVAIKSAMEKKRQMLKTLKDAKIKVKILPDAFPEKMRTLESLNETARGGYERIKNLRRLIARMKSVLEEKQLAKK